MNGLFLMPERSFELIYGSEIQNTISRMVTLVGPRMDAGNYAETKEQLEEVEAIFSGWGMPRMDSAFFQVFPSLRVVFYGAGAVNTFVTDEVWERGIQIANANVANGIAVADYAVAQVYLCLKNVWQQSRRVHQMRDFASARVPAAGAYQSTVGLLSLGAIGRIVAERLKLSDLNVIAYDPFVSPADAAVLNVELTSLESVFDRADVISCHTPWLPETEGLLTGELFRRMRRGASFINTARGAVVNEPEMLQVLSDRPDLFAVLDVTHPEPPVPDSRIYDLPNVLLTPHIAGSVGRECRRMGESMVEELRRWLNGEPLRYPVTQEYARAFL